MIKTTYHFIHKITIISIIFLTTLTILFAHKYTLIFLAQKVLKDNHIQYTKVEGSLFNGITLYDVAYKNILHAKKVQLNYKLMSIIKVKPIIKNIKTKQLYIDIDKFPSKNKNNNFSLIPFSILNLHSDHTTIIFNKKKYLFNLQMKQIIYNKNINAKKVLLDIKSYYLNAVIKAKIKNNTLIGKSDNLRIKQSIHKKYLKFIQDIPKTLHVNLILNEKSIKLNTIIPSFTLKTDKNITIHNQHLNIAYIVEQHIFKASSNYLLAYKNHITKIDQKITFHANGNYTSNINAKLNKLYKNIPIKNIYAKIDGNRKQFHANIKASDFNISINSDDYKKYIIKIKNKKLSLSFLKNIPKQLQKDYFDFTSLLTLHLAPVTIDGKIHIKDKFALTDAYFRYTKNIKEINAKIKLKKDTPLYKEFPVNFTYPININYKQFKSKSTILIKAKQFHTIITKNNFGILKGKGEIRSLHFNLNGKIQKNFDTHIKLHTNIPSLKQFLQDMNLTLQDDKTVYDGKIKLTSDIIFKKTLSIRNTIYSPFLSAKINSQNKYVLKDILFKTDYKKNKINIYNYKLYYKQQKFYSNKTSTITIDQNNTLHIDKFYLYDNLILKGVINIFKNKIKLNIHSNKFTLKTDDFNVKAKTDLNIEINNKQSQNIYGYITLLDGTISYQPQKDYNIEDDDIIIIQDLQKQKKNNLSLNIKLNAAKKIRYKTKDINVHFIPNIIIKKESTKKIKLYGKITVLDGFINTKAKEFTFEKSELIFSGETNINPELNIKLHFQTIDYKDIIIRISNTLNSPVLIFSSNPAMSQNDIMSYILFDEPASSLFDNSTQTNKTSINYLLLGTGIKNIFNQSTGIHVDTLNILDNEDGTLGYEIGARLNKKLRIVYKNDVISSMILQYSLGKTLRIDVDVHDTGQGVSFIYTKDFKDF